MTPEQIAHENARHEAALRRARVKFEDAETKND